MQTTTSLSDEVTPQDAYLAAFAGIGVICVIAAIVILILLSTRLESTNTQEVVDPAAGPVQTELAEGEVASIAWQRDGYNWTLLPRARYQVAGRVLGSQTYRDWKSPIMPLDLALAWGELSNPAVDEWINWSQSSRWLRYRWPGNSPYKSAIVVPNSANNHIIPATDNLKAILGRIEVNDAVLLEGLLVDVAVLRDGTTNSDYLRTSLSRLDSGNTACENFYVERLVINSKEYH